MYGVWCMVCGVVWCGVVWCGVVWCARQCSTVSSLDERDEIEKRVIAIARVAIGDPDHTIPYHYFWDFFGFLKF